MRVTVLGSGSAGNAILVETPEVRLLVDAGFSGRDLERRLAGVEVAPDSIDALLITHDHSDHTKGMGILARRFGIPLLLTEPTRDACAKLLNGTEQVRLYSSAEPLFLGDLQVDPFLTIHDAVDPVAVTVTQTGTGEKLGIATDLGRPTTTVRHALQGCDLLVLEANYDEILLRESPYPWSVKSRIASSHGHLSNRASAELVGELAHPWLAGVVLAHLSENANDPALAEDTVGQALERARFRGELHLGRQHRPIEPIDVARLRARLQPEQLPLL
ncbi:MAG TPA: MBL fold metallo-hydrolase [Longimicrobiaceae bacterium]|nr:MBL fold metallo-hydrolase [Longimicrobiaceae bacterium]